MKRVLILVLAMTMMFASVAHAEIAFHGQDYSMLTDSHERLWACDEERDGVQAYAEGRYGGGIIFRLTDESGADPNCYSKNPNGIGNFGAHRMCEPGAGCGVWISH